MKKPLLLLLFAATSSCTTAHKVDDEGEYVHVLPVLPKSPSQAFSKSSISHLLYMIQAGKTEEAIDTLLSMKSDDPYIFHEGTLEKLGQGLLEQGSKSRDPQDLLTCLYGVGISQDDTTLNIAANALAYDEPQLQLVAVSVLSSFDTEAASELISRAMKSNYIFVRLEAAYCLALRRSSNAYGQLASLMSKVDPELHELFPRLFAMEASLESQKMLKSLLYDRNEQVRRESILAVANFGRDDFLEDIRTLAKEPSFVQQEACAYALGMFGDEASRELLERLAASSSPSVRLAAYRSLHTLGCDKAKTYIAQQAALGDCFAISLMGSLEGDDAVLVKLLAHEDVNVRTNAAMALLQRRDGRCLQGVADVLIDSHCDYTLQSIASHGASLRCWKVTASSSQHLAKHPQFFEVSHRAREQMLISALELPEDDFIDLAEAIFVSNQHDLVPLTVKLLENLRSEKAVNLLKSHEQRLGAPFIRAWCCLGLYRMHQEGPYAEKVLRIVEKHEDKEVFKARAVLPWKLRQEETRYQLTLEESCALLIESFEALALRQDAKGIEALLRAIRNGNPHNRYTLAGLLMRASL